MVKFVLQIVEGPQSGAKHELATDLTIGRRSGCDVVLDGDEKVSGRHCQVVIEGGGVLLRDLESTNGTRVDGKRIEEIPIAHGDRFQVGKTVLQLVDTERGEVVEVPMAASGINADALARARKRSPVALIALLVLLLGGGAAWWFFLRADAPRNKSSVKKVEPIEGNLLSASLAHLEAGDDEWLPMTSGGVWTRGGSGKSGRSSLVAELGGESDGAAGPSFAVAMQPKAMPIGRATAFRARCAVRADGDARVGLRLCFFPKAPIVPPTDDIEEGEEGDEAPRRFERKPLIVLGPALQSISASKWSALELSATVPPGVEEVALAVVAALPSGRRDEVSVRVDDIGLLEDPSSAADPKQIAGVSIYSDAVSGAMRVTVGARVLLTASSALPASSDEPLSALAKVCPLPSSDVGAAIESVKIEGDWVRYRMTSQPSGGLILRVGRDIASSYRVRTGVDDAARFAQHAGAAKIEGVTGLLWGADAQALLFELGAATALEVTDDGAELSFSFASCPLDVSLRVGFEEERLETLRLARAAAAARSEGRPIDAMRLYRKILTERPFDESAVREARVARGELLQAARSDLQTLDRDFEEARAFEYEGLFDDLLRRADQLDARQDEFKDQIAAFRAKVRERLEEVRRARGERRAENLMTLSRSLEASGQKRLANLVKSFVEIKLPAPRKDDDDEGKD